MRYHLLFECEINGRRSSGEDVIITDDDLEMAARMIAKARGASSIFVKKRFWSNRPAKDADVINKMFVLHEGRQDADR